jgi:ankyrin repeat protein
VAYRRDAFVHCEECSWDAHALGCPARKAKDKKAKGKAKAKSTGKAKAQAAPKAKAKDGRTAIFGAATFGLNQVIQYLYDHGATVDYKDNQGLSPLDAASGKAGGFGFTGADGVFWQDTVDLLQALTETGKTRQATR